MNAYITIGYDKRGKAKILAMPSVPYAKQKELLRSAEKGFVRVELWSRSNGKIKHRRPKATPEKKVLTIPETDKNTEDNNNEEQ